MMKSEKNDKALFFSLLPLQQTGGGETYTRNCAISIANSGIECHLISPTEFSFIYTKDKSRFESLFDKTIFIREKSFQDPAQESFVEILSTIHEYKYVWIHQYLATPLVFDILLVNHPDQIILFTNLGFEENAGDFWIRYNRLPNHLFVEISQYSASRTKKHTPNVGYVYAGAWKKKLEKSFFKIFPKNRQFVSVGRLLPHKAFEIAIDALSDNDHLVIIGPESQDKRYKKFLETKIKGKNIDIVGEVPSSDRDNIVSRSLALIANSSSVTYDNKVFEQSELLGLVLIEAILNNTLPISSSQLALKEVMTLLQIEEFIYTERETQSLKSKMLFVRSLTAEEYRELVEKAKKIIEHLFLWDNYWTRVQQLIDGNMRTTAPFMESNNK
ncbi:glycosyltransferase [Nostoc sp.]